MLGWLRLGLLCIVILFRLIKSRNIEIMNSVVVRVGTQVLGL